MTLEVLAMQFEHGVCEGRLEFRRLFTLCTHVHAMTSDSLARTKLKAQTHKLGTWKPTYRKKTDERGTPGCDCRGGRAAAPS